MARPLRIEFPGAVYHVTSRGNARADIFADAEDRASFLKLLQSVVKRYRWQCHAYCLMDNHYHLLIETPDGNLSRGMRELNGRFTQHYNRRHRRVGHLLQGRFKAILVEKESHLLALCRYIVRNPVAAEMVQSAGDWPWSSYLATAGAIPDGELLTTAWILAQFGASSTTARVRYQRYVAEADEAVSPWEALRGGVLLGDEAFVERFREVLDERRDHTEIPQKERLVDRPPLEVLFAGVEDAAARHRVAHRACVEWDYTQKAVADYLGVHYATVGRWVKRAGNV